MMNNTLEIRIGLMPGKLQKILVEQGTTARECFKIAEVEITNNHEVRLDGNKIDIDTRIESGSLLCGMKLIKGNI